MTEVQHISIAFDSLIPIILQIITKFKLIGSLVNFSKEYSKKLACSINSSLLQFISILHFIDDHNKSSTDFLKGTIKNNPIKYIEVITDKKNL